MTEFFYGFYFLSQNESIFIFRKGKKKNRDQQVDRWERRIIHRLLALTGAPSRHCYKILVNLRGSTAVPRTEILLLQNIYIKYIELDLENSNPTSFNPQSCTRINTKL